MALLLTTPAPLIACTPMVLRPSVLPSASQTPALTWTAKRPLVSVVPVPMTWLKNGSPGVRSISLIVTVLPKALCSLKPSMIGRITRVILSVNEPGMLGSPESLPPCAGGSGPFGSRFIELTKTSGARRMANWPRPKVEATNRSGPVLRLGRPVVGLMVPSDRSRSRTLTAGIRPPSAGTFASSLWVGKAVQVPALSRER